MYYETNQAYHCDMRNRFLFSAASPLLTIVVYIVVLVAVVAAVAVDTTMTSLTPAAIQSAASALAIGEPGTPWGVLEKQKWRESRIPSRSYFDDIVPRIQAIREQHADDFVVVQYGNLPQYQDNDKNDDKATTTTCSSFPLFAIRTKQWSKSKPSVLITGGVHGYETSGVEAALEFIEHGTAQQYAHRGFNICVCPCISPWGYERHQRWNAEAVDPNRSFNPDGTIVAGRSFNPEPATAESAAVLHFLRTTMATLMGTDGDVGWTVHIDLHETTDTDNTEFIPAKAKRDGHVPTTRPDAIPDGFYLVQDTTAPQPAWFAAMIAKVRTVTHIAPPDAQGKLIGEDVTMDGVIGIPSNRALGLCAGVTSAPYRVSFVIIYLFFRNGIRNRSNAKNVLLG